MTPLGLLNFVVLQWFGVRLIVRLVPDPRVALVVAPPGRTYPRQIGWAVLRWVWPLTGWWSPYRWISRSR